MPCGESGSFEELRGQLGSLITHVLRTIEQHPVPETAYAQASQVREDLQAASDEAAMVRAATVLRIKEVGHLSVAGVGERIGVTKARAQDMLEKAAKRPRNQLSVSTPASAGQPAPESAGE